MLYINRQTYKHKGYVYVCISTYNLRNIKLFDSKKYMSRLVCILTNTWQGSPYSVSLSLYLSPVSLASDKQVRMCMRMCITNTNPHKLNGCKRERERERERERVWWSVSPSLTLTNVGQDHGLSPSLLGSCQPVEFTYRL